MQARNQKRIRFEYWLVLTGLCAFSTTFADQVPRSSPGGGQKPEALQSEKTPSTKPAPVANPVDPDADYDRLDYKGKSGMRVDVIEWQENLEVHIYPAGKTVSLAMKLDKRNKDKPVMVIGYRFKSDPNTQLIRRAVLSIPINENFNVYKDTTDPEYDKFIVSNHVLSGKVTKVTLEAGPHQLYPDGRPELENTKAAASASPTSAPASSSSPTHNSNSSPQSDSRTSGSSQSQNPSSQTPSAENSPKNSEDTQQDNGIRSFQW